MASTWPSARVEWAPPTTNTAGQTFDNSSNDRTLVSYRIYYGTDQSAVTAGTSASVLLSASVCMWSFFGLAPGTWYFRVVAIDGDGDESSGVTVSTKVIS